MSEIKSLPRNDLEAALSLAGQCRLEGDLSTAESMCLDVLDLEPESQPALVLLVTVRANLLDRGLPRGIERAREVLPRLTSEYDQAYYAAFICEHQARYMLAQRGRRTGSVAWEWFQFAIEHYEDASRIAPEKLDPVLRSNSCVRLVEGNRHCAPERHELDEHGIE